MTSVLSPALRQVLDRAADPQMRHKWELQVQRTGYCIRPVRLTGSSSTIAETTGAVLGSFDTTGEPDGALLMACRSRRATVCPPCSRTYQADSYQLVAAGLRGGKGIPETVAAHPRLFVTLTAPSFGPVHSRRLTPDGKTQPCHPGRGHCPHGVRRGCNRRHPDGDDQLGQPLCSECFDYQGAVLWHAQAGELWRRTTINILRALATGLGIPVRTVTRQVRLSYTKIAEYQARGLVHFHAVIRLDANVGSDTLPIPPPPCYTVDALIAAIHAAAKTTTAPALTADPDRPGEMRWGAQLDIACIPNETNTATGSHAIAGYIAKYATKSTDPLGVLDHRLRSLDELDALDVNPHLDRLVRTCWRLGQQKHLPELRLRRWAHCLGYRGHWATRSRRYSATLTALRTARQRWNLRQIDTANEPLLRIGRWRYAGTGFRNTGDAWLAATTRHQHEQSRHLARLDTRLLQAA